MRYSYIVLTAAILGIGFSQGAAAQSNVPPRPIVKPNIMPDPVANRLVKRPVPAKLQDAEKAAK